MKPEIALSLTSPDPRLGSGVHTVYAGVLNQQQQQAGKSELAP